LLRKSIRGLFGSISLVLFRGACLHTITQLVDIVVDYRLQSIKQSINQSFDLL